MQPSTIRLERITFPFSEIWLPFILTVLGTFVVLPFLAPIFMHLGWEIPARVIYFIYSFLCHQLPERSLYLFGPQMMYSLQEVQTVWQDSLNPLIFRQFIGTPEMGWKVAWSDRMVSMYTGIWLFGLQWWFMRYRIHPLPWWGFALLLSPMALDGTTHFISDLAGVEQGFRQSNLWLAELTRHAFPTSFYIGNALGSFNSWMRWMSGMFFGLGIVGFGFPYLDKAFSPDQSNTLQFLD